MRAGFIRCSGFIGPFGSHQRPASRSNFATSSSRTVVISVSVWVAPAARGQYVCAPSVTWQLFMARIVMKFGGTSVADLDRIRNVASRVKREVEAGNQVAVVVSAMSGVTNQLVKYCTELSPLHDAREYDAVVATGEQVTSGLLAIALQGLGIDARSWQGWQIPLRTDRAHSKARI